MHSLASAPAMPCANGMDFGLDLVKPPGSQALCKKSLCCLRKNLDRIPMGDIEDRVVRRNG